MSAINAISNLTQNLYPAVQGFTSPTPATSTTANSISGTVTTSPATLASALQQAKGKGHKHGGGMLKKIEQAVTSALQSSSPSADPNQVVQDAIANALKQGANPQSTSVTDTDGDNDAAAQQTFLQTLKSFGITPERFRNDLATAIQNSQKGGTSGSSVSAFPPGLFLDTAA
jgi:hypothetical protein